MTEQGHEQAISEIARILRTQDNRATDAPIFIVEEKRRVYGFDPAYADKDEIVWIDSEGDEADAEKRASLEAAWDEDGEEPEDWTRTAYKDEWHFVTACFTEKGCLDYIARNGHNHRGELRTYAAGSYRNEEWRTVRSFLMSLGEQKSAALDEEKALKRSLDQAMAYAEQMTNAIRDVRADLDRARQMVMDLVPTGEARGVAVDDLLATAADRLRDF